MGRMDKQDETIEDILSLTQYEGEPNKLSIFCRIIALLMENRVTGGSPERILLIQMVDTLWGDISMSLREALAKRVAAAKAPPEDLTRRFALDRLEVAAQVLERAPFEDQTLVEIIGKTGRGHHLVIAKRKNLSQEVWKTLSASGKSESKREAESEPAGHPEKGGEGLFSLQLGKQKPTRVKISEARGKTDVKGLPLVEALVAAAMEDRKNTAKRAGAIEPKSTPPVREWKWRTDRSGQIAEIDQTSTAAFGLGPDQLIGQNFFSLIRDIPDTGEPLIAAAANSHPIRGIPAEIQDGFGNVTKWSIEGRACFEMRTGKFKGYLGSASEIVPAGEIVGPAAPAPSAKGRSRTSPMSNRLLNALADTADDPARALSVTLEKMAARAEQAGDREALDEVERVVVYCEQLRRLIDNPGWLLSGSDVKPGNDRGS